MSTFHFVEHVLFRLLTHTGATHEQKTRSCPRQSVS